MATTTRTRTSRSPGWGWGLLIALAGLLLVNGVWLYLEVGSSAIIEADTGVSASELRSAFPGVADELTSRGRTIALLLVALGALALSVAVAGARTGAAWTRTSMMVFTAALLLVGVHALAGGRVDIGAFYLLWSLLAGVGLLLAAPRGSRARA